MASPACGRVNLLFQRGFIGEMYPLVAGQVGVWKTNDLRHTFFMRARDHDRPTYRLIET
jgi:hypothetical protein